VGVELGGTEQTTAKMLLLLSWVISILLRLYTSIEHLKTVYTSLKKKKKISYLIEIIDENVLDVAYLSLIPT
jgi:hypothetical protein